jgi:hypothetical protein
MDNRKWITENILEYFRIMITKKYKKTIYSNKKKSKKDSKKDSKSSRSHSRTSSKLYLIPLSNINTNQIKQLARITNDKSVMQHIGTGKLWSVQDIIDFKKDEINEIKKELSKRDYISYFLLKNNIVVGFISGRKNRKLLPKNIGNYDLLLRMFISSNEAGKGFGKIIINKFIETYKKLIERNRLKSMKGMKGIKDLKLDKNIILYSDISPDNIPSKKIHEFNMFEFKEVVKYPNGHFYERWILKI